MAVDFKEGFHSGRPINYNGKSSEDRTGKGDKEALALGFNLSFVRRIH